MKKSNLHIQARDRLVFEFLWRWKLATTATLALKFFPGIQPKVVYNRLLGLKRSGFIRLRVDYDSEVNVWGLDVNGYKSIETLLPALSKPGYGSESIHHDLLVSAVQNGNWLIERPEGVELITETELKRYYPEHLPDWIPKSKVRIADGYWKFPDGEMNTIIALEVELTQKPYSEYVTIGKFYALQNFVYRVLWLVRRMSIAKSIAKIFQETNPRGPDKNNFIIENDFRKSGWATKIQMGPDVGKTVSEILNTTPMNSPCNYIALALLDARKCSNETVPYDQRLAHRISCFT